MMTKRERKAMQQAIDVAWRDPAGAEFRERLFPEGRPTVDLFVARVAAYARELTNRGDRVVDSTWEHT